MSLKEESENNFIILSNSREFKFDKFQVALRMLRFKKDPTFFLSGFYRLNTKCEDNNIIEKFIEAAKTGNPPELTLNNVPIYQQLSIEFEFNSLFRECNNYLLNQHDLSKLVSNLLSPTYNFSSGLNKDLTLNAIETAFAFNISQHHINQLKSLPNCVIYKILSNPNRPISHLEKSLYDLIKSKIDSGDDEAKFLLSAIKYNTFNHNDLTSVMNISYHETTNLHTKQEKSNQAQNNNQKQNQNNNQKQNQNNNNQNNNQKQNQNNNAKQNQNQNNSQKQNQSQPQNQSQQRQSKSNNPSQNKNTEKTETETPQSAPPPTQPHRSKIARAPDAARASSTNLQQDGFQSVYIPENSEIKITEKRIIEIINTRRSQEFPLTLDQQVSLKMQSYYGSREEIKPPTETDYLILEDRFSCDVEHRHRYILLENNENAIYDRIRSEIEKVPIEDISNSNFLALTVIKVANGYLCAIVFGNSKEGLDQIDSNPPQNSSLPLPTTKPSASTPNIAIDLIESVKQAFYSNNSSSLSEDVQNIFFNLDYSKQLSNLLDKVDRENTRIDNRNILELIPDLKGCQIFIKIVPKHSFFEGIKAFNKNKNNYIVALAVKEMSSGKYGALIACIDETFSGEEIQIIDFIKNISKEKCFDFSYYKILKKFISQPQNLPEEGDTIEPFMKKDDPYKYVFLKANTFDEIKSKLPKYRNKVVVSKKFAASICKLTNPDCYQFIFSYSK